jgi:poly-gamma-glutamate synthesis protein (capsule biosynthesis protein)
MLPALRHPGFAGQQRRLDGTGNPSRDDFGSRRFSTCGVRLATVVTMALSLVAAGSSRAEEKRDVEAPRRRASPAGVVSVVFVGDIMLDNGPGNLVTAGRDPFAACRQHLLDADFTVGNLECVLGKGGRQVLKPYTFRGAADSPRFLKPYFSVLGVANNHALDFGPDGLLECLAVLDRAGIPHCGGGKDLAAARRPYLLEKDGVTVAILAGNDFQGERWAAAADAAGVNPLRETEFLADIAAARKQADAVVPFVHWGPELVAQPYERHRTFARKMIDAGAAAVIGAHPHVTQTVDTHAGAPIVYSLGNFVFDYYPDDPPEWTGWIAKLTFAKGRPVDLETLAVVLDAAGIPKPVEQDE